jgi:hypothetical protein
VRAYTSLHDVGEWDSGEAVSLEEDGRILTLEEFRNLARSMDGVHVSNRLGTETLVVGSEAMGSLGWPDPGHAMLQLRPEDQMRMMGLAPAVFTPVLGAAGKRGGTLVALRALTVEQAVPALKAAFSRALARPVRAGLGAKPPLARS